MTSNTQALFGLTEQHLTQLPNGSLLHSQVVKPFLALQAAAKTAGFDLQIASSFRNFQQQQAIWDAKFCGKRAILDQNNQTVDISSLTEWEICQAILLYSALPGASRHHWGCDFDYFDANGFDNNNSLQLVSNEYDKQGPCGALYAWLKQHAKHYGFYFPYQDYLGGIAAEPWHLSYYAIAQSFAKQLTVNELAIQLAHTQIQGQHTIIHHLRYIFDQYINNINEFNHE